MPDERVPPLHICDDRPESERHWWDEEYTSGDTCLCGRFYLSAGKTSDWFTFEVKRTPVDEEE